ncbi:MAG TPA: hypothetical protein VHV47_05590 [Opitutaceae bacterium]|jgi:hypothetical protein|nr:hypothetical protein [Opitutaceae bacterium]
MNSTHFHLLASALGLLGGGVIGLGFGLLQDRAVRRHERLQNEGRFKSGWAATPGSFRRIAYLLVALALVQFSCPVLFAPGDPAQWFVSAGVMLGYGWALYGQMRRRLA